MTQQHDDLLAEEFADAIIDGLDEYSILHAGHGLPGGYTHGAIMRNRVIAWLKAYRVAHPLFVKVTKVGTPDCWWNERIGDVFLVIGVAKPVSKDGWITVEVDGRRTTIEFLHCEFVEVIND